MTKRLYEKQYGAMVGTAAGQSQRPRKVKKTDNGFISTNHKWSASELERFNRTLSRLRRILDEKGNPYSEIVDKQETK